MECPAGPSRKLPDLCIVKPKLEPGNDYTPPGAGEDQETTPLSGDRPFFTALMARTHVQKPYYLYIPAHFHRCIVAADSTSRLPARRTGAVLRCGGRSWIMGYCGGSKQKRFDGAWANFAVDNRLLVGDACVFELVSGVGGGAGQLVFDVQVLRGGGMPWELAAKGATSDDPIVIVD